MLENIISFYANETIYRLAVRLEESKLFESMTLDSRGSVEALEFFRENMQTDAIEFVLDDPFKPKPQFETEVLKSTRFSDGGVHVFYGALERGTAEAEVKYHYGKDAVGDKSKARTVFYACVECRYMGNTKDLRPKLSEWPELVSEDYQFCQNLSRQAIRENLGGFFAPSARLTNGTTVPVFQREMLSAPEIVGCISFSIDPSSGNISATNLSNS